MPQTIEKIHPAYKTQIVCKKCESRVQYEKVDIRRDDGAPDWYLNVVCCCGVVKDKKIIEECYNINKRRACQAIHADQNKTLADYLGADLAERTHNINGGSF